MKKFLPYILVALTGFLISSFLTRGGVSFGFPLDVYGPNTCLRGDGSSYYARFFPCDAGWHWMSAVYDCIFWFVVAIISVNFYKAIKNNPRELMKYLVIALIGILISSFPFRDGFGYPYTVIDFPRICVPDMQIGPGRDGGWDCPGISWNALTYDIIFWLVASFIVVHFYKFIKTNFNLNFQLNNVLRKISSLGLILGVIIGLGILIFIGLSFVSGSGGQEAYCGGFTGRAACPFGYYCPRGGYPDELKQCVSWFKF